MYIPYKNCGVKITLFGDDHTKICHFNTAGVTFIHAYKCYQDPALEVVKSNSNTVEITPTILAPVKRCCRGSQITPGVFKFNTQVFAAL